MITLAVTGALPLRAQTMMVFAPQLEIYVGPESLYEPDERHRMCEAIGDAIRGNWELLVRQHESEIVGFYATLGTNSRQMLRRAPLKVSDGRVEVARSVARSTNSGDSLVMPTEYWADARWVSESMRWLGAVSRGVNVESVEAVRAVGDVVLLACDGSVCGWAIDGFDVLALGNEYATGSQEKRKQAAALLRDLLAHVNDDVFLALEEGDGTAFAALDELRARAGGVAGGKRLVEFIDRYVASAR